MNVAASPDAIREIVKLALAAQAPREVSGLNPNTIPFLITPDGSVVTPAVPARPSRIKQSVEFHSAGSFAAYVNSFKREGTIIFFNQADRKFTAVIDYHGAGSGSEANESPRWCDHIAEYTAETTPEWNTWYYHNKKPFGQVEFAEFLEDNLVEVIEPAGASLLEITRTLEAKKDVSYSSAIRLNNGSFRINFDEQIKGTANTQAGVIDIPTDIKLEMQVLRGGSVFRFPARFKYRLKDRQLSLWYEIVRPLKLIEQAVNEAIQLIEESTSLEVLDGIIDWA